MKNFSLTGEGNVRSEWIDRNGHMNIARYLDLFDNACDTLLTRSGLLSPGSDLTFVAGRVHMANRRELFEGDEWKTWSGYISVDEHSIVFSHRLTGGAIEGPTKGGSICATCDIHSKPFSMQKRLSVPFAPDLVETARDFVVPGLQNPFSAPIRGPSEI